MGKKLTSKEFAEYLEWVREAKKDTVLQPDKWWRMGQTYFNVLHALHPKIANEYRSSCIDPFYNDNLIGDFLSHLYANHVHDELA